MREKSQYLKFIGEFSEFFKKGFPIFLAVLAGIFINIYTSKLNVDIASSFDLLIIYSFVILALIAILISTISTAILYFIMVWGFGSFTFLVQKLSNFLFRRFGLTIALLLSLDIALVGFFIMNRFEYPSFYWVLGLTLEIIGFIPCIYLSRNKIVINHAIPFYVG